MTFNKRWATKFLNIINHDLNLPLAISKCQHVIGGWYASCHLCDTFPYRSNILIVNVIQLFNIREIRIDFRNISYKMQAILKLYKLIVKNHSIQNLLLNIYENHNYGYTLIVPCITYFKNKLINKYFRLCYMINYKHYLHEKFIFIF